jgi:hypothetical protein
MAACRGYLEFARANPAMFELMFRHDLIDARDPGLSVKSTAVFDLFAAMVGEVQAEGWHPGSDPRLLAASLALWASLHGLAELWLWGGLASAGFAPPIELPLAVTLDAYFGSPSREIPLSDKDHPQRLRTGAESSPSLSRTA